MSAVVPVCREVSNLRRILLLAVLGSAAASAQDTPPGNLPTFQSKVNLVLVPVVVRDAAGSPIGNLTKDDFELFDKRKRQIISSFSAIRRPAQPARLASPQVNTNATPPASAESARGLLTSPSPERYLIYLFDDLNIEFADMAAVREAAARHMQRSLAATDRAAIYTASGRPTLDFTADREKLESTVRKLRMQLTFGHGGMQCTNVSYFLADSILNKGDDQAFAAVVQHIEVCARVSKPIAEGLASSAARQELYVGEQDTRVIFGTLRRAIRQLAKMPGQRLIVLASPGFFVATPDATRDMADLFDQAAKANVTISSLDARGVYTVEADASDLGAPPKLWLQYRRMSAQSNKDVLAELAEGTGGTFFHNNNDLDAGFNRVAAAPEFSYVLGFSPAGLKANDSFHSLKVRLSNGKGMKIEARRGYYALKHDPVEEASLAIDDAVFSLGEMSGIPLDVATQVSKSAAGTAKLMVVAQLRVASLHLHKSEERNRDSLTVISALFDDDGAYVAGTRKTVNLALRDETLHRADHPGINVQSDFAMKPGTYRLRVVVRESEGTAMSAQNRTVTIP